MGALSRGLVVGSAVLGLYALLVHTRAYWPFTVDDTFITLRYAKHLAEGLGPAWNPGGPAVEGYTTVLWMLLLAVPHALGLDALAVAKGLGVLLTYASVCVAGLLACELTRELDARARRVAALAPFALSAAYWPLALHAISGMETALAGFLLTLFGLVAVRVVRSPTPPRMRSLSLLALSCALTRPETTLSCAVTLAAVLGALPGTTRKGLARVLAVYLALPGLCYFAARYAYFGMPFPLSLYVKGTGQERFAGWEDVRLFFEPFFAQRPLVGMLLFYGALRARRFVPVLLGLLAFTLFFLLPAHVMGFEGRYLMPLFPSLAALVGVGLAELVTLALGALERPRPLRHAGPVLALLALALLASRGFPEHEAAARTRWLSYGEGLERAHGALASALRKARLSVVRPSIALLDVGAVGYHSEWRVIDTYGLNDARVALSRRTDVAYVLAHRPELLVVVSAQADRYVPVFAFEEPIHAAARERGYDPLCTYRFLDDYHLLVLARPGSPIREALACPRWVEAGAAQAARR